MPRFPDELFTYMYPTHMMLLILLGVADLLVGYILLSPKEPGLATRVLAACTLVSGLVLTPGPILACFFPWLTHLVRYAATVNLAFPLVFVGLSLVSEQPAGAVLAGLWFFMILAIRSYAHRTEPAL